MLGNASLLGRQAVRATRIVPRTMTTSSSTLSQNRVLSTLNKSAFQQRSKIVERASVAKFHSSSKKEILTPLPQRIDGTSNDAVPHMDPHPTHGSYHWGMERAISVALIPLTIAPFAAGSLNPVMDAVLVSTLVIHSHIGFQSIITDYLPRKRMPKIRALFWWGLNAGTVLVAVGLYEFETNDVGLTEGIKRIWIA